MLPASSTRPSLSARVQESPSSNETNNSFGIGFSTQDHLCDSSTEHLKHRQKQDLLGLEPETFTNSVPDIEADSSDEVLEAIPQDQISACSVHSSILSNADALPGKAGEIKYAPMDRYLAEGITERYALFNIGSSGSGGQWTRYFSCLCEK
jgi:hypothetical protein